jgi:hypothetical protein
MASVAGANYTLPNRGDGLLDMSTPTEIPAPESVLWYASAENQPLGNLNTADWVSDGLGDYRGFRNGAKIPQVVDNRLYGGAQGLEFEVLGNNVGGDGNFRCEITTQGYNRRSNNWQGVHQFVGFSMWIDDGWTLEPENGSNTTLLFNTHYESNDPTPAGSPPIGVRVRCNDGMLILDQEIEPAANQDWTLGVTVDELKGRWVRWVLEWELQGTPTGFFRLWFDDVLIIEQTDVITYSPSANQMCYYKWGLYPSYHQNRSAQDKKIWVDEMRIADANQGAQYATVDPASYTDPGGPGPGPVPGSRYWENDFEIFSDGLFFNNDIWLDNPDGSGNNEVTGFWQRYPESRPVAISPGYGGSARAVRCFIPADSNTGDGSSGDRGRSEMNTRFPEKNVPPWQNKEEWFGFACRYSGPASGYGGRVVICQMHAPPDDPTTTDWSPTVAIRVAENGDLVVTQEYLDAGNVKRTADWQTGKRVADISGDWHKIVQNIKWTGDNTGFIRVWLDDEQILNQENIQTYATNASAYGWWRAGLYCSWMNNAPHPYDITLDLDKVCMADAATGADYSTVDPDRWGSAQTFTVSRDGTLRRQ